MPKINFIGPTYQLRSAAVDNQRTINMYPDINEISDQKTQLFFTGTPGLKTFITPKAVVRGMFVNAKGDLYVAEGQEFCRYAYDGVDSEGKVYLRRTVLGGIYTTSGPVSMADNKFQLCVVDGDNLYVYIYKDETFQQYTPGGWLGSDVVVNFNNYFLFVERKSQTYFISALYDGTNISADDFQLKENYADNIATAISFNNYVWLLGEKTTQILYNSGDVFPFSNMDGGTSNIGCIAKRSASICSNTLFWLGRDENGQGTVYCTSGSAQPTRVSNFAVDYFLQSQANISDATAYSYQEDGHNFYVLNFPSAGTTWVYDFNTKMWHERQYLAQNGQEERHRAEFHVYWNGMHLVSDYKANNIYHMSLNFVSDDGNPIKRYRRSPHLSGPDLERIFFNEFQLDMEVGNNDIDKAHIYLRYSSDGGNTWSSLLKNDLGSKGEYSKRVIWRRLGSSRDRVWEVSLTDPVKFTLINAYVR